MAMTDTHLQTNVYNVIRLNDMENFTKHTIAKFIRLKTELHTHATEPRISAAIDAAIARLEANGERIKQPVDMLAVSRIPLTMQITRKEINDLDASVIDEMYADMTNRYAKKSAKYGTDWIDTDYERLRYALHIAW